MRWGVGWRGGGNKVMGVYLVSGEKLHEFEILYPKIGPFMS